MSLTKKQIDFLFSQISNGFSMLNHHNPYDYSSALKTYHAALSSSITTSQKDYLCDSFEYSAYKRNIIIMQTTFTFYWNIDKLTKIITTQKLSPISFNVHDAYVVVDMNNIDKNRFDKLSVSPIFIGIIPFSIPPYLVLDGNHRVAKAYDSHKSTILAYLLNPQLHINAMYPDCQLIFKVLTNVAMISQYIEGFISLVELKTLLFDF